MSTRRWSIRGRLVATVVGLLLLAFVITGGATFGAVQDWRAQQADGLLTIAADQVAAATTTGSAASAAPDLATVVGPATPLWRELAGHGDVPAFFQLRRSDGRVVETVGIGSGPVLPEPLPAALQPGPDGPLGVRFVAVEGAGGEPWRLRSARVSTASSDVLLVAQRDTASAELTERVRNVVVGTSLAALLVLALLSGQLVRRGLRPLTDIAVTATAIGAGDLTRRVEDTSGRTEVGRLGRALNAMLGQLDRAFTERTRSEERLRRFVADASHELRTPVATIRGYAELFRRGAAHRPADLADAMHRIEAEATRMGTLVDELLLLARLDEGRPDERTPVDLAEVVARAVEDARAVDPERPIALDVEGDTVVPGDGPRLEQVVANLFSNIRAHTPPGAPARVRLRGRPDTVELEVSDSGPGLGETDRQRVFERFYQARGTAERRDGHGGAGLGLAIVAAVVAAHGGEATAAPAAGGGCAFLVTLPRRE